MEQPNPFKKTMNALQKQWYKVLIARRVGVVRPQVVQPSKDITYQAVCADRYKSSTRRYNKQFTKEVKNLEQMQPSAIDAMRLHRTFAITTLWLPLHSRKEINLTLEKLEKVVDSGDRRRLEQILSRNGR